MRWLLYTAQHDTDTPVAIFETLADAKAWTDKKYPPTSEWNELEDLGNWVRSAGDKRVVLTLLPFHAHVPTYAGVSA